jgi:aminoglycoside phosphotransferase family enzyme/predicted kinase
MDQQTLHTALMCPEAWPQGRNEVEFCETHVSRLYFVGDRVYKVKKPVDFGFLDFTTLDRRHFYCTEEVRLNQRFAPDTYLAVLELRAEGTRVTVDGPGILVDYAVAMRRLPRERMLDVLIARDAPELPAAMVPLGRTLAALHRTSEICREAGTDLCRIRQNWRENFSQVARLGGTTLATRGLELSRAYVAGFIDRRASLLAAREAAGEVRDGHGDLHAEHVCLTRPLRIYDCIEFNRRFRVADTAADLAFLLMDLEYRGRRDLAVGLLEAYRGSAGPDAERPLLLPFYKFYRAWVRAKVDSFLGADPGVQPATRAAATVRARRYFNLALGYLCRPRLLLTCGLMGSGKSTLAAPLATALGALLLRSDAVRKELAGARSAGSDQAAFNQGIYAPDFSRTTYSRLLALAGEGLRTGRTVIVDAAFGDPKRRQTFLDLATAQGVPGTILWIDCPPAIARQRLVERRQAGQDLSDGRPELYAAQAAGFSIPAPPEPLIRVDTTGDVDYNVQSILCELANH